MKMRRYHTRRGFSLTELAIVLAVIGSLVAVVWSYGKTARQAEHLAQALQAIQLTADATRGSYGGAASISGATTTVVVPYLIQTGAIPSNLVQPANAACATTYANSPWPTNAATDPCGSFRVCGWNYVIAGTGNTKCATPSDPASAQFFAIELKQLDYGSCLQLAEGVVPTIPVGLQDVYINGVSLVGAGSGLPVSPSIAAANCTTASPPANVVDFVYTLRTPVS